MRTGTLAALAALFLIHGTGSLNLGELDLRGTIDRVVNPDGPEPSPATPDEKAPSEDLQSLVEPIRAKLGGQADKAKRVAAAATGFANAIDGPAGEKITTTGQFNELVGLASGWLDIGGGVSIADEVRSVFAAHVPIDADPDAPSLDVDRPIDASDRARIVEAYRAIAWAAVQPKRGD